MLSVTDSPVVRAPENETRLADAELADAIDMGDESWFWPVGGEKASVLDVLCDLRGTRDALDAARSEVQRLTKAVARAQGSENYMEKHLQAQDNRVRGLRSEVERLRRFADNADIARRETHRALNRVHAEMQVLRQDRDSEDHWASQYCAERDQARSEVADLRAAVLALHKPYDRPEFDTGPYCMECRRDFPCATARAATGPAGHAGKENR